MKQSFVYGTLILLTASLFNRIIGFAYQIFLIRLIRPEGIGLLNMIYPIYVLVLVMASAGVPVAISKLVAEEVARENWRGANRLFNICFTFLLISSIIFTSLCLLCAPYLIKYIFHNPKVFNIFLCLLPGIIIVTLCSAFRGYYQGLQQMKPTAATQVLEQLVRVVAGLILATLLLPRGIEYAAAGASMGIIIGEVAGFAAILAIYLKKRPHFTEGFSSAPDEPLPRSLGRIFNLAIPVTLTRIVATSLISIDAVLIPLRLQASGLSLDEATSVFGQFVGIAQSLLFIPGIITISMATALIPAISDAIGLKKITLIHARCEEAIRITLLAGLPSAVILMLLAESLCGLIFGYSEAGDILRILALGGPFLYLQQTSTGILQGLGEALRPFRNMVFASLFKITGIYYLTGLSNLGIKGTAAAMVAGYFVMAFLNLRDIQRLTRLKPHWHKIFIKPFIAALGMSPAILLSKSSLYSYTGSELAATIGAFLAGISCYLILLFLTGGIKIHDLLRLRTAFNSNIKV
jgi:stage V sporulation protein B